MTASGRLSLPPEYLRDQLADCPAWQALCAAADAIQARAKTHRDRLPPPANGHSYTAAELADYRPYAVIYTAPERGFRMDRAALGTYLDSGAVLLEIERDVPLEYSDDEAGANVDFENRLGAIFEELVARADTGDFLAVRSIELVEIVRGEEEFEQAGKGPFQLAVALCQWGPPR